MKNRSRIALLVATLFMLGTGTITAYQSMSKTIAIVDDGRVSQYETWDVYVEDVLDSQEIIIGPKDEVTPDLEEVVENGTKIVIERWKPTVSVIIDGEETSFKTDQETVGAVLETKNITIDENSECSVSLEAKIEDGMEIDIKTRKVTTETLEEEIAFETQIVQTKELEAGQQRVVAEGKNGVKQVVKEIVHFGGEFVEENITEETIIIEPQTKIIEEGIKNVIVDTNTGKAYEYTSTFTADATAYTDIPGNKWYGITASGLPTFVGMVAVDRSVIPLGTMLYVEDYGIAIAGDVGGAIKGYDIDLYYESYDAAIEFGRRDRQVYILEDQTIDVHEERKHY